MAKPTKCFDCKHFKSHYPHGKGSGWCLVKADPFECARWYDSERFCVDFSEKGK